MDIGEPQRVWESEPLDDPIEMPVDPTESEPAREPATTP